MGILSSLESAAEMAGEALGITHKTDEAENAVSAEAGAEVDTDQLQEPVADAAPPAETAQTYTVQSGDTLSKISEQYYGNSHDYLKIFEANRDTLDDPNQIEVGQELNIPS